MSIAVYLADCVAAAFHALLRQLDLAGGRLFMGAATNTISLPQLGSSLLAKAVRFFAVHSGIVIIGLPTL